MRIVTDNVEVEADLNRLNKKVRAYEAVDLAQQWQDEDKETIAKAERLSAQLRRGELE